jgi:hypothetical protein
MQEMAGARPMERRPSLPDLTAYAGEKGGQPRALRHRRYYPLSKECTRGLCASCHADRSA